MLLSMHQLPAFLFSSNESAIMSRAILLEVGQFGVPESATSSFTDCRHHCIHIDVLPVAKPGNSCAFASGNRPIAARTSR